MGINDAQILDIIYLALYMYDMINLLTSVIRVSEWSLFNTKWAIIQLFNVKNKLHFNEMIMSTLY